MRKSIGEAEATQAEELSRNGRRQAAKQAREPEYLTRQQAADTANLSRRTLERLERDGDGPPTIRVGAKVLYPATDLHAWLRARIVAKAVAA